MVLRESTDQLVRAAGSPVQTGRKWKTEEEAVRLLKESRKVE